MVYQDFDRHIKVISEFEMNMASRLSHNDAYTKLFAFLNYSTIFINCSLYFI